MILNMMVSTGGSSAASVQKSVTFYGGIGETLTLYGDTTQAITLNSNGIGTATIPTGEYTILGSLSKEALPNGKAVSITQNTSIVTAYPDGAIFWFGNGNSDGDPLKNKFSGFTSDSQLRPDVGNVGKVADFTFTPKTDCYEIYYKWNGTGTGYVIVANAYLNDTLSVDNYSFIKVSGSMTGSGSWYTTNNLSHEFTPIDSASGLPAKVSAGSRLVFNQTGYIDPYGSMKNTVTLKAIWLE